MTLANNKRRSRAQFWKRGSYWGKYGEWVLGRQSQMQQHLADISSGEEDQLPALPEALIKPNWGEVPHAGGRTKRVV